MSVISRSDESKQVERADNADSQAREDSMHHSGAPARARPGPHPGSKRKGCTMQASTWQRRGGAAGIVAAASFVTESVLLGHSPSINQPTSDISYFGAQRGTALAGMYLPGFGAAALPSSSRAGSCPKATTSTARRQQEVRVGWHRT